ncbi:hypothetical protein, partial [Escherichia coli]|uniref:hypothetical protein n=1 Tax=Escherichia coli TaxID=562 RepID=UPI00201AE8FE
KLAASPMFSEYRQNKSFLKLQHSREEKPISLPNRHIDRICLVIFTKVVRQRRSGKCLLNRLW